MSLVSSLSVLSAATLAMAHGTLGAEVGERAKLLEKGNAVQVRVDVTCAPGHEVLEAFVYVGQDGNTSPFAGLPVTCDGTTRSHKVRVPANPDQPFHGGQATASSFVLVVDQVTGETHSAGDFVEMRVSGKPAKK